MSAREQQIFRLIGKKVRELRDTQVPRMSQDDLARALGLQRTSITNIESGVQKMTLDTLFRLCERFQIEAADVLPKLHELSRSGETHVQIGGHSESVGAKTASLLERIRPSGSSSSPRGRRAPANSSP